MQSKGAIRFVAILLALACAWQLSFTLVTKIHEGKADKYAEAAVLAIQNSAKFTNIPEADKAYFLDSIRKENNRVYLDSVSSKNVYLGYTFKEVREKEVNLGLDLKGGMNVMLQLQLEQLIISLSNENQTPEFLNTLALTKERSIDSSEDFIKLFAEAWEETSNGMPLSQIFGNPINEGKINAKTSNAEVISVLEASAAEARESSFKVLRKRIDGFGVTQPSIQEIGNTGRILVELPGVKEPERVRKLLQGTASLEFWATYNNAEILPFLQEANSTIANIIAETEGASEEVATQADKKEGVDSLLNEELSQLAKETEASEKFKKENPLFAALQIAQPMSGHSNACIGYANYSDTAKINKWFKMDEIKSIFPAEFKPLWSVKASPMFDNDNTFELVAIMITSNDGKARIDGTKIQSATVEYSNTGGSPGVSMNMYADGATEWKNMTRDNIGKQIAIVLDGMVYSYPTVQNEIAGGRSSITGNFDIAEAEDLANVLEAGKLPVSAIIIQEQVVGPSLGAESINSGLISFIIAFVLVLIYMVFFYQGAGLVANIALLANVLFLFGTLVSFGAVLTLPGIAGLVLTLGMAVDANVIIYERIKEELRAGKGLGKAITDGYSNAYSAIVDGQITTILTGVVLFILGSGPVKGFATTLIIGIITSVVTSIFITRLIFEARVAKGKSISFDNNMTRNFLQNTKIDFLSKRKITYIASAIVILISTVSFFTKGFTYGIDFTGGRSYVVRFDQPVQAEDVRSAALAEFENSVEVKQFGGDSQMKITTSYLRDDKSTEADAKVEAKLHSALKGFYTSEISIDEFTSTLDNPNGIISSDKVGPAIANEIKVDAIIAVILSLLVIFAYIAFRFKNWTWGLGGVVSLAHTAFIVIGFFSIFTGILPFSLDIDQTFIAAILTIIGYAINDNVVIFDRIREYKELHPKADFKDNVNSALNSTLSRTLNTSITTLMVMVAIAIFGGEVIRGLAVALIVGIVVGTYASIFIGTPVMFDLTRFEAKKKANK